MGTTSSKPHQGGIENRDNEMVSPTSAGIFPLPPSKPSSSSSTLRRREVEIPAKRPSYRDFPSSNEEPNQQRRQRDEEEEEEDEDENDIYSFLPPNHHDDDDDHDDDGYIGTAAHPRRRRGLGSRIRTSLGFRDDVAICTAAFSRLSKGTRLASMLIAGGLGLYAACRLLPGTATRAGDGRTTASKFFSGLADAFGGGPAEDFGYEGRVLTKDQLRGARREARAVVDLLHGYYGGETRAKNMLARSWQEEWKLDLEEYLEREEEDADEAPIWDDDDDSFGDDDDTGQEDDDDRTRTNDNDNDNEHRTRRSLNNKYVKKAKVIHNHPDNLTPDQIQRRKHHSKQRTTRLIATVARALLDPHRDDFSIGILGDTAAAGIDNCRYDSYDSQLERTLSSVFRAAGMSLRVRNTAQGAQCGDTHENQIWCVQHSVGFDVDVLHYSWSYSEHGGGQAVRENLIRWARQMPRQPMVHQLNVRGKSNTCDGDNLNDVLLNEAYAAFAYNVFCIQTGLHFGGYDYDGELEETGINRFGRQQVGDGYHDTTRYGELETDDDRKHSLGTVFRNWNPGPLGFQMASDALAYVYSMGVLMALELIERDWNAGLDPRDRWFVKYTSDDVDVESIGTSNIDADANADDFAGRRRRLEPQLSLPVDDVPEPLFCDPLYCSTPHPPSCLDYELPAFGAPGPAVRTPTGWTIVRDDNHDWTRGVGTMDVAILKRWDDDYWYRTCSHSDACGCIAASDSSQGELIIELPAREVTVGLIVVCGCCGKNVADDMFLKNGNLEIKWNGKKLNKSKMDVYPNDKCVRVVKAFKEFDKNSDVSKAEQMLLSFHLKKNAKEVKISHVISL